MCLVAGSCGAGSCVSLVTVLGPQVAMKQGKNLYLGPFIRLLAIFFGKLGNRGTNSAASSNLSAGTSWKRSCAWPSPRNLARASTQICLQPAASSTPQPACRDELEEVMRLVKPQTFLPVHGEYSFLCAHAQLGREVGIRHTSVIRNGQMLGVAERRNGREVSTGSRAAAEAAGLRLIGEAKLTMLYNDGNKVSPLQSQHCALGQWPENDWRG